MPTGPTPAILEASNRFRIRLLAQEREAAARMARYYGHIWGELQPQITGLQSEVRAIRAAGKEVGEGMLWRLDRLQAIQSQAGTELLKFSQFTSVEITAKQREAIVAAERNAREMIGAAFPADAGIEVSFATMPRASVEALAGTLADGSPLQALLQDAVGDAAVSFAKEMVTGIAAGWNPRKLAGRLRSKFGMGLTRALRISRTEQLRAYHTATQRAYAESDVVVGWERHAEKGARTCMACIALDGKRYEVSEAMDDHINGRCAMLPITKSYADLGIDAPEPDFEREYAADWFRDLDETDQLEMMGPKMFGAWKEGQFGLDDIPKAIRSDVWGNSWVPKSVEELIAGRGERWRPDQPWVGPVGGIKDAPDTPNSVIDGWLNQGGEDPRFGPTGEFAKDEIVTALSERTGMDYDEVNEFIAQWAETSGDYDMRSLAIQRDAAEVFGTDLSPWQKERIEGIQAALRKSPLSDNPAYRPLMGSEQQKTLIQEMYDYTQERLQDKEIGSTVRLVRGVTLDPSVVEGWAKAQGVAVSELQDTTVPYFGNVLESWSNSRVTAKEFADYSGRDMVGVVLEMDVPVERLMGSARSGFGCLHEGEFIHIGGLPGDVARIREIIGG